MAEESNIAKNISSIASKIIKSILPSKKNDEEEKPKAENNTTNVRQPKQQPENDNKLKIERVDAQKLSATNKSSYEILTEIVNQSVIFKNKIKGVEKFFYEREQTVENVQEESFTQRIKKLLSKVKLLPDDDAKSRKRDKSSGLMDFLGFIAFAFLPVIMNFLKSVTSFKDLFKDVAQGLAKIISDAVSLAFNVVLGLVVDKIREEFGIKDIEAYIKSNLPKTISGLILNDEGFIKGLTPTPEATKPQETTAPSAPAVPAPVQEVPTVDATRLPGIESTLKRIAGSESAGKYNIAYGETISTAGTLARRFSGGKDLTEMTFEEVEQFQKSLPKAETAVGKYQFIQSTLFGAKGQLIKSAGLTMKDKFTPEAQERLAQAMTEQNDAMLKKNGIPLTDANRYMAHFIGPGGATAVHKAIAKGENITVAEAYRNAGFGDVTSGNQVNLELKRIKVGDFERYLEKRMPSGQQDSKKQVASMVPLAPKGDQLEKDSKSGAAEEEKINNQPPKVVINPPSGAKEQPKVASTNVKVSDPVNTQGVQSLYLTRLATV